MLQSAGLGTRRSLPRQCKRRRSSFASVESEDGALLHYDVLPETALENVVRFLSEKPMLDNWHCFVPPETVLALIRSGGALASVTRATIRDVETVKDVNVYTKRNGVLLVGSNHQNRSCTSAIVSGIGPGLRKLFVVQPSVPKWLARTIANQCANLRHLALRLDNAKCCANLPVIFAARGASLHILEMDVLELHAPQIASIAEHCRALRRLKLYSCIVTASLGLVWQAVGKTLRDVELRCQMNVDILALPFLGFHCPNVYRLVFTLFRTLPECVAVENLCAEYGPRLLNLELVKSELDIKTLRRICTACPNVEIDVRTFSNTSGMGADHMVAMGSRATSLVVGEEMANGHGVIEDLSRVGNACPNLMKIKLLVDQLSESVFRGLFTHPKPKLREFCLEFLDDEIPSTAVMKVLSEKVTTLEYLSYRGTCPPMDILRAFVTANSGLREVKLTNWGMCICTPLDLRFAEPEYLSQSLGLNWPAVVAEFLRCPKLAVLDCECIFRSGRRIEELVEVCSPRHFCPISVSICGRQYM